MNCNCHRCVIEKKYKDEIDDILKNEDITPSKKNDLYLLIDEILEQTELFNN